MRTLPRQQRQAGAFGCQDLTVTTLTPDEMIQVISDGASRGMMPGLQEALTSEEIRAVAEYGDGTEKLTTWSLVLSVEF